ncbi:MAG: glutathione S-transferase family protein [Archangiaceae bacterium]|nr:glutathione S-transferase family protein [Archangiaceae bacterium]
MTALTLYYVPKTRATRVRWLLEELGAPYRLARLDPSKGETKTDEHTRRHPLQDVPVLQTPSGALFESCAMCLHLAAGTPLLPPDGSYERGLVYQWVLFGVSELEGLLGRLAGERKKAAADPKRIEAVMLKLAQPLAALEQALAGREWLVGEGFTVADLLCGALLVWANRLELLGELPNARAYVARVESRPAFRRALAD